MLILKEVIIQQDYFINTFRTYIHLFFNDNLMKKANYFNKPSFIRGKSLSQNEMKASL